MQDPFSSNPRKRTPKEQIPFVIADAIGSWRKNKARSSRNLIKGPANEVVAENFDLYKLPIPVHALEDGGRYLDSSIVVARNPETGVINTSIHRMMVTRKNRLTFLIILKDRIGHILNPIVSVNADGKGGTITKIGLDATTPYPKTKLFERVCFKEVDLNNYVIEE